MSPTQRPTEYVLFPIPINKILDLEEGIAFDFFKRRTSIKLPGIFHSEFWNSLVFRASAEEPAVLHALTALGAFSLSKATEENQRDCDDAYRASKYENLALRQYNKSIGCLRLHFRGKDDNELRVALITCMVFICIELLRQRSETASTHLSHGIQLLCEIQGRQQAPRAVKSLILRPDPESANDVLIEAFTRLNMHSALWGNCSLFLYHISQDGMYEPDYEIPSVFDTFVERDYTSTV